MNQILIFLSGSLIAIAIYYIKLKKSLSAAPRLASAPATNLDSFKISVIIPAYNEAENIAECVLAALQKTKLQQGLEVLVVDDRSLDNTLAIIGNLSTELNDSRLKIIAGEPRPQGEIWVGKNWACHQAITVAQGDYFLFIDADVRLKQDSIETALYHATQNNLDLLTLLPGIDCDCLAEWLVQPLMINLLAVGFDYASVNDPQAENAFASGPFMLFRRTAYEKIGGHRAVASEVVEDVELARAIKQAGLRLQVLVGSDYLCARMYRNWNALWEGWTKNLYLGAQRQLFPMIQIIVGVLAIYTIPWLCLLLIIGKFFTNSANYSDYLGLGLATIIIVLQYAARTLAGKNSQTPNHYWWLAGIGGILVAAITLASVIKTETGWGWTWRGRALKSS
jgi:glycosyltransferase involved in cell wall biosynthesis